MTTPGFRELVAKSLFRALSARWSENEAFYRQELEEACVAMFDNIPATKDGFAEASARMFVAVDFVVATLDHLLGAMEKTFGLPRPQTADILEDVLNEIVAELDNEEDAT